LEGAASKGRETAGDGDQPAAGDSRERSGAFGIHRCVAWLQIRCKSSQTDRAAMHLFAFAKETTLEGGAIFYPTKFPAKSGKIP
jgi:hypothetical protein